MPERFKDQPFDAFQLTIVDCPGHSSFIRTVIGGAQIIDFMLLVIDATKGVQTQTAEGLVIAELTTDVLVVALNKVDMFERGEEDPAFMAMRQKVAVILSKTKFGKPPLVAVAAHPKSGSPTGLAALTEQLVASAPLPKRDIVAKDRFLFSVDHCFVLKGQGTVMTGTVLRGSVAVNDTIEIADLKVEKKVKSMQMFRKPLDVARQGDRLGICVTQFDSGALERGIVCFPGSVKTISAALVSCSLIRYYQSNVVSGGRFHISIGHRTATARVFFLSASADKGDDEWVYEWVAQAAALPAVNVALLKFDSPLLCPDDSLYIGSKLDADESTPGCRIAFHGRVRRGVGEGEGFEGTPLRVFKRKERFAVIERVVSDTEAICRGLFKSYDMNQLAGFRLVRECDGAVGEIRGNFGSAKNAKFKVSFGKGGFEAMQEGQSKRMVFRFKKFLGSAAEKDPKKKWVQ